MALDAADALLGVRAALPVIDDARRVLEVAIRRSLASWPARSTCGGRMPSSSSLRTNLHPLHEEQRAQKRQAQHDNDPLFGLKCHAFDRSVDVN